MQTFSKVVDMAAATQTASFRHAYGLLRYEQRCLLVRASPAAVHAVSLLRLQETMGMMGTAITADTPLPLICSASLSSPHPTELLLELLALMWCNSTGGKVLLDQPCEP